MKIIEDLLENKDKYNVSGNIPGNYDDFELSYDLFSAAKEKQEMFNFVSKEDINMSGIESDNFKKRIARNESEELMNRVYISNNYRGFGYEKNIKDFENTMQNILYMAISTTPDNEIKKNAMIEELQRDVMSCFNEKAKSNEDVLKDINAKIEKAKAKYNIPLSERIFENMTILVSRYRMSIFNLKDSSIISDGIKSEESRNNKSISTLNTLIEKINDDMKKEEDKIDIRLLFKNIKNKNAFSLEFKQELAEKTNNKDEAMTIIDRMELHISEVEDSAKNITKISKNDRIASIAINYFLAEKNLLEMNEKKKAGKIKYNEMFSALSSNPALAIKKQKEIIRLLQEDKNGKENKKKENYINRVSERLKDNPKINLNISRQEIEDAIEECRKMLVTYANVGDDKKIEDKMSENEKVAILINQTVDKKIKDIGSGVSIKTLDADIMETVTVAIKDNLANNILQKQQDKYKEQIISDIKNGKKDYESHPDKKLLMTNKMQMTLERYSLDEISKDAAIKEIREIKNDRNNYKVDIEKNLNSNGYGYKGDKVDNLLASDNVRKLFNLINERKITTEEALTVVQNNRDLLKGFTIEERDAVELLIKDAAEIKKNQAIERKKESKTANNLFDNIDKDYDENMEVANYMKREGVIKQILNDTNHKKRGFRRAVGNFFASSDMIHGLAHCATKQVETRKMDTQLSMASQCIDTYKQKAESHIKHLEDSMEKSLSNPAFAMSGFGFLLVLATMHQKTKLYNDKKAILENEKSISKIINHIDSVPEQKVKDALVNLYKLENQFQKNPLKITNTIDKELFLDAKKTIFYSELLMHSEKEYIVSETNKFGIKMPKMEKLKDMIHNEDNALLNLKKILDRSNPELYADVENALIKRSEDVFKNKDMGLLLNAKQDEQQFEKEQALRVQQIEKTLVKAQEEYKEVLSKSLPEMKEKISQLKSSEDLLNLDLDRELDAETVDKLNSFVNKMKSIKMELGDAKESLNSSRKKIIHLKNEIDKTNPFADLLNERNKLDTKKLAEEIKNNPDKVITSLFSLKNEKGEKLIDNNSLKKDLLFHITDRAANSNNYTITASEYFNEIVTRVMPHEKNLIEDISEYKFESTENSDINKINLTLSKKSVEKESLLDKTKDIAKNIHNKYLNGKDNASTKAGDKTIEALANSIGISK